MVARVKPAWMWRAFLYKSAENKITDSPFPQATRVEDVYRLQELAPDDFLAYMEEQATAILTDQQELDPK